MNFTDNFSFETINNFDKHIQQSIANYEILADSIQNIAKYFLLQNTKLIDIGCSTGSLLESIKHDGTKIGIDTAKNLLPKSQNDVIYINEDLITFNNYDNSSLVLSIFTLQFIDKRFRQNILHSIYNGLVEGGAFIWAEKVMCNNGNDQEIMTFAHYDYKQKHFEASEILNKERDLRLILRPNTSEQNQQLAKNAGFSKGLMFWKFYNFECWLYRKDSLNA